MGLQRESEQFRATVLIVDDSTDNIVLLSELLKDKYKLKIANNGEKALQIASAESKPDLILLDLMMPGISGYDVCTKLKSQPTTLHIPIIFITGMTTAEDETKGLSLGAVDYITKPFNPAIVLARVRTQIENKEAVDFIRNKNVYLEEEIYKRMIEINAIQDVTILSMAALAETRDPNIGSHIMRTQYYVKALADNLKNHPRFKDFLTDKNIGLLFKSVPLHDIGKVRIPSSILMKPGPLDPDEFEIMKTHTTLGREALVSVEKTLGIEIRFLKMAKEIAYSHQEKWNGSGYPDGLSGDDIPISARLMALADVYDALICHRPYKKAIPHEEAIEIISQGHGTHFDPDIVEAFLEIHDDFKIISERHSNQNE